jgi:hypothetical protein
MKTTPATTPPQSALKLKHNPKLFNHPPNQNNTILPDVRLTQIQRNSLFPLPIALSAKKSHSSPDTARPLQLSTYIQTNRIQNLLQKCRPQHLGLFDFNAVLKAFFMLTKVSAQYSTTHHFYHEKRYKFPP